VILVLDPFLGSGTTAVMAKKLQRNFIGFEQDPDYIKLAKKRLKKYRTSIK
jgi:DNA modification methylase